MLIVQQGKYLQTVSTSETIQKKKHKLYTKKKMDIASKQQETSQNPKDNSDYLIEYKAVEETPFTLAKHNNEWFVLLGKHRLTDGFKTDKEALINAKSITWNRIMSVIIICLKDQAQILKYYE